MPGLISISFGAARRTLRPRRKGMARWQAFPKFTKVLAAKPRSQGEACLARKTLRGSLAEAPRSARYAKRLESSLQPMLARSFWEKREPARNSLHERSII